MLSYLFPFVRKFCILQSLERFRNGYKQDWYKAWRTWLTTRDDGLLLLPSSSFFQSENSLNCPLVRSFVSRYFWWTISAKRKMVHNPLERKRCDSLLFQKADCFAPVKHDRLFLSLLSSPFCTPPRVNSYAALNPSFFNVTHHSIFVTHIHSSKP